MLYSYLLEQLYVVGKMRTTKITNRHAGFTIIELLVVVSIMIILTATVVPSLGDMVKRSSLSAETNQLIATLRSARSQAVLYQQSVRVCRANPSITDTTLPLCQVNGSNIVMMSSSELVQSLPAPPATIILPAIDVTFLQNGSVTRAQTFSITSSSGESTTLSINLAGMVRLES